MVANLYRRLNILSIDVALGAMCSALFFAKLLQVRVLIVGIVCLGLTVWIIYTIDHLLDARRIGKTASMERHQFHQKYFRVLFKLVILAVLTNAVLAFLIRERVLVGGVFLSVGVVLYLLINHYLKILKELLISIFYTCGVLMPSIMVTNFSWVEIPWIVVAQFVLVAFMNLLVFSWYDYAHDHGDGTASFATKVGKKVTQAVILGVLVCVVILFFFTALEKASGLLVLMAILQFIIYWNKNRLHVRDRFRLLSEAIFMLPILYFFF